MASITAAGKNRIMIYGPKDDTCDALAGPIPRTEAGVIRHFQERNALWTVRTGRSVRNLPMRFPSGGMKGNDKAGHAVPETLALLHRT